MAQLRNLGMPFGSPGGIINIPAPVGSQLAGQIQMQSLQGLGQALGMYLGQRKAGQLAQEDFRRLQAMGPQQDILNTMYWARGLTAPEAQIPEMQSPKYRDLVMQAQLGNIFGDPYGLRSAQAEFYRARAAEAGRPEQESPFTLSPGGRRYNAAGELIAEAPEKREPRAGQMQIAKSGDGTGLPEGTVFQSDPEGNIKIISEPDVLTLDEKRRRELIAGGLEPKAISELERKLTQSQIAKNRAEIRDLRRKSGGVLTGDDKMRVSTILRKEFDALSSDFRKIRDSFGRIKAAASDPSAAGDLAIIFNFMKILDPNSVVRESEFATAENAAGVPDKIRNMWNKALSGERIAFNRQDFLNTSERLFKSQEDIQNKQINRYSNLAKRFGVEAQDVITETGEFGFERPITDMSDEELRRIAGEQ